MLTAAASPEMGISCSGEQSAGETGAVGVACGMTAAGDGGAIVASHLVVASGSGGMGVGVAADVGVEDAGEGDGRAGAQEVRSAMSSKRRERMRGRRIGSILSESGRTGAGISPWNNRAAARLSHAVARASTAAEGSKLDVHGRIILCERNKQGEP